MTKEVKTGMMAFIILVVAMAVFLFVRPKDWFGGNYFHMTASFSSVQGIKKGNEVRYAGVRVGEVSKISTEGNEGILEMRIKKDAQIPLDAEFTVSQSGVIGDYYVDIRGGHFIHNLHALWYWHTSVADHKSILVSKSRDQPCKLRIDNTSFFHLNRPPIHFFSQKIPACTSHRDQICFICFRCVPEAPFLPEDFSGTGQ